MLTAWMNREPFKKTLLFDNQDEPEYPNHRYCKGPAYDPDGRTELTFGAWALNSSPLELKGNGQTILGWGEDAGWGECLIRYKTNEGGYISSMFARIGSSNSEKEINLPRDTWGFFAATYSSRTMKLYFNGNQIGQFSASQIKSCTPFITIGAACNNVSSPVDQCPMTFGSICGCFIFGRALSGEEMREAYLGGLINPMKSPWNNGLEYGWNMTDGSGELCAEVNGREPLHVMNGMKWECKMNPPN